MASFTPLSNHLGSVVARTFELTNLTDSGKSFCELEFYILRNMCNVYNELCDFKTRIDEST